MGRMKNHFVEEHIEQGKGAGKITNKGQGIKKYM